MPTNSGNNTPTSQTRPTHSEEIKIRIPKAEAIQRRRWLHPTLQEARWRWMGRGTVVLAPAMEDISSLPARHIRTGTEMQKEPTGTHWVALQVHSSRHLREIWQILGWHRGAGMIIISQWLVKHPSVRQRIKNSWQLSEEFCLRYTPQIGIRT